uniref:DUF7633 domain-containing protein n=1 Tax=Craspedostauros australis TaxID=1486917 RepID=A0A7R9ZNW9_9STRA
MWNKTPLNPPFRVLASNVDTVEFQFFSSAWGMDEVLPFVYTSYNKPASMPDQECVLDENVSSADVITHTAQCNSATNTAIVDLFIVDGPNFDPATDDANIPRCCHADAESAHDGAAVVQYVFVIDCTPSGADGAETPNRVRGLRGSSA